MSQIHPDILMSSSQESVTTVSLMNGSKKSAQLVNKDLLYRLDGLFAFYHRQWLCHRQNLDRIENLRVRTTDGGVRGIFDQDANLG